MISGKETPGKWEIRRLWWIPSTVSPGLKPKNWWMPLPTPGSRWISPNRPASLFNRQTVSMDSWHASQLKGPA